MYKMQRNYQNQQIFRFEGDGKYCIPEIKPTELDVDGANWVSFNYAKNYRQAENSVCHFYLDDYQFERLWACPDKYTDMMCRFKSVTSPDFSLFSDYPRAVQIYNHFRKHWLGAFYQMLGATVIPTICWGDENTYDFCFDGEPKDSIVTVSDLGCLQNKESKKMFYNGFQKMIELLHPKEIWLYTSAPSLERFEGIDTSKIKIIGNSNIEKMRKNAEDAKEKPLD